MHLHRNIVRKVKTFTTHCRRVILANYDYVVNILPRLREAYIDSWRCFSEFIWAFQMESGYFYDSRKNGNARGSLASMR